MKKIAQIIRNAHRRLMTMAEQAWDLLLVFVVLCIAHFDGEEETQEITPENETR